MGSNVTRVRAYLEGTMLDIIKFDRKMILASFFILVGGYTEYTEKYN